MKRIVLLAAVSLPMSLHAQTCPTPAHPYFEFQVEVQARYVSSDSAGPHPVVDAPSASRARADTFVVQFSVDTTGRAVPSSLKFLRGGSPTSWDAVRAALPNWHFQPAEAPKGCRVVQLVQTAIDG